MSTLTVNAKPSAFQPVKEWMTHHPTVAYFVIAFAGTWLFWWPLALAQEVNGLGVLPFSVSESMFYLIGTLGGFAGPPLAAFVVTAITLGRAGVKQLLQRCIQWRAGIQWYLFIIFGTLVIYLTGFSILFDMNLFKALLDQWTLLFTLFLTATLFSLVTANFGEEVGWRGFAMPRLQRQFGPLGATLILGGLHSLWHLPLLFTRLLGPTNWLDLAGFIVAGISMTVLYTWVFNHTRGSVLIAALFHAFANGAGGIIGALIPANLVVAGWAAPLVHGGWKGDLIFCIGGFALLLIVFTKGRLGYAPASATVL